MECERRWAERDQDLNCNLYPKPHDIDITIAGEGCPPGVEDTIRANYEACLNAKKAAWFPLIQAHCQNYNSLNQEIYYKDSEIAELQYQLCIERCELDNCLAQALETKEASMAECWDTLETDLQVCDDAYAYCVENQQPNCWEQYEQCVDNADSEFDSCVANAKMQYKTDVFVCYTSHGNQINFLEQQIAVLKAELDDLREERAMESRLYNRAWQSLVSAYGDCLTSAQAEAEALSHPSAVPGENCIITVTQSNRALEIDC